jgi:UDP-N-acetylmuramate dehydrogenase
MMPEEFKDLRGRCEANAPLGAKTWFAAGGTADLLFRPEDANDLENFLNQYPADAPLMVLGVGSNVIVRDGGVRGAVVRLGRGFNYVSIDGNEVTAGAATLDLNVARKVAEAGLSGLSFMAGIPGTIGGAVRMNAGAYGGETKDSLLSIDMFNDRKRTTLRRDQIEMTYRHTDLAPDAIVVAATFGPLGQGDPTILEAETEDIQTRRADSQPIKAKTGGSTFANPDPSVLMAAGLSPEMKTWQLIDAVGGRGHRVGDAQVSEKHCNFLINTGSATAADIEKCGEDVRARVYSRFGIDLRWEIKRIGDSL